MSGRTEILEKPRNVSGRGRARACNGMGKTPVVALENVLTEPPAKPYIVIHLEASDSDNRINGETIVKCINKFMGDTHAIVLAGYKRSSYLEEIAQAINHSQFKDMVGRLSADALLYLVSGADAVATGSWGIFRLADRLGIPVLLLDATTADPLKPWSQYGYQLGLLDEQSNPYRICEALAYLLSFSAQRPSLGAYLI